MKDQKKEEGQSKNPQLHQISLISGKQKKSISLLLEIWPKSFFVERPKDHIWLLDAEDKKKLDEELSELRKSSNNFDFKTLLKN